VTSVSEGGAPVRSGGLAPADLPGLPAAPAAPASPPTVGQRAATA